MQALKRRYSITLATYRCYDSSQTIFALSSSAFGMKTGLRGACQGCRVIPDSVRTEILHTRGKIARFLSRSNATQDQSPVSNCLLRHPVRRALSCRKGQSGGICISNSQCHVHSPSSHPFTPLEAKDRLSRICAQLCERSALLRL